MCVTVSRRARAKLRLSCWCRVCGAGIMWFLMYKRSRPFLTKYFKFLDVFAGRGLLFI